MGTSAASIFVRDSGEEAAMVGQVRKSSVRIEVRLSPVHVHQLYVSSQAGIGPHRRPGRRIDGPLPEPLRSRGRRRSRSKSIRLSSSELPGNTSTSATNREKTATITTSTLSRRTDSEHLAKTKKRYDVIYMDAFLKPQEATDQTGVPRNLRLPRVLQEHPDEAEPRTG